MALSKQVVLLAIYLLAGSMKLDMFPPVMAHGGSELTVVDADAWLENLPPFEKHLRSLNPDLNIQAHEAHQSKSHERYEALMERVKGSVATRDVITIEDSEIDDHMQGLVSAKRGFSPKAIITQGGDWTLRRQHYELMYGHYHKKFGIPMPNFYTISRRPKRGYLSTFVTHEGLGNISKEKRLKLQQDTYDEKKEKLFNDEVESAKGIIRKQLENNDFTTFVVKAPPTWLGKVIDEKYAWKDKVAIVWSSAITPKGGTYEARFNYQKDYPNSDYLLDLHLPTVSLTPALSDVDLVAIFDKEYKHVYNDATPWPSRFDGFENLKLLEPSPERVVATFMENSQREFMLSKMNHAMSKAEKLKKDQVNLEEKISTLTELVKTYAEKSPRYQELITPKEKPASSSLNEDIGQEAATSSVNEDLSRKFSTSGANADLSRKSDTGSHDPWSIENIIDIEKQWGNAEDKEDALLLNNMVKLRVAKKELISVTRDINREFSRGSSWIVANNKLGEGHNYRDFGVNDIFVEILLHPEWCSSTVSRVMEMSFKRRIVSSDAHAEIFGIPQIGGNFFVPTRVDSTPLSKAIQEIINWSLAGENSLVGNGEDVQRSVDLIHEGDPSSVGDEMEVSKSVKHSRKRRAVGAGTRLEGSEAMKKSFGGPVQSA